MSTIRIDQQTAVLRLGYPEFEQLRALLLARYPSAEWATFARFGWRSTPSGLVMTLASLDPPGDGDLDESVEHVAIQEPYTLRVALRAEQHPLAVGIVHSHPRDCPPAPSRVDDDMDGYYSRYFADFAPGRPFVSAIVSESTAGALTISARVFWNGRWARARKVVVEGTPAATWPAAHQEVLQRHRARTARLLSAFGDDAAARLRRATVGVIGAGGTGSAAIEVLARAGVGRLVVVDPDTLEPSNLERVHGSRPEHASARIYKVALAREHVHSIDPSCEVEAIVSSLPHAEVIDALLDADVVLGCTDQQHSRVALSDLSVRYLVPSIDCGVVLEGKNGRITAQVLQLVRFLAADPCVYCRSMVIAERVSQELMSDAERESRQQAAREAEARGEPGNAYWSDVPQLNTVGYHTTIAGAMAAGYAIGWITGRFAPPFSRLQMNLVAPQLEVIDIADSSDVECVCRRVRGWADVANADALISAPRHWPKPIRL